MGIRSKGNIIENISELDNALHYIRRDWEVHVLNKVDKT